MLGTTNSSDILFVIPKFQVMITLSTACISDSIVIHVAHPSNARQVGVAWRAQPSVQAGGCKGPEALLHALTQLLARCKHCGLWQLFNMQDSDMAPHKLRHGTT